MAQIKKDTSLRKAILQAAITGQLISSCHSELDSESAETGKELLDRIIEERNNKLLAEWEEKKTDLFASNDAHSKNAKTVRSEQIRLSKKIKKPEPIVASEIDEEEIPFEIPENWCWCRLGDICNEIKRGKSPKYADRSDYLAFAQKCNVKTGGIDLSLALYLDEKSIDRYSEKDNLIQGDVVINSTGGGTMGRVGYYETKVPEGIKGVYPDSHVTVIRSIGNINQHYLYYILKHNQPVLEDCGTGSTNQTELKPSVLANLVIPLPPLAVQNAIVAKLEQVLPLVDAYENALLQKEELKSELPDKVKKAIMQEAITGQLTEAWRKSATIKESGKQLLDRIIEERNAKALADWEEALKKNSKAKKPVSVVASEIEEDEIPFEVPESWCWCRLGDLVPFGQCENAEPNEIEDDAWILDLEDIEKDSGRILQFKTKKEVDSKSTKHIFKKGYVLYSKLRPYLNKCVIAPQDGYCTSEILPLDFGKLINNKFAQTFLMSPYFVDYTDSLSFGVKMPRLGTEDGKKALVPLPPLEEQEEIVKKVEELLPLCK